MEAGNLKCTKELGEREVAEIVSIHFTMAF